MESTELGMVMDAKLLQSWNAPVPIEVTELGSSIDVKLLHWWNA